MQRSPGPTFPLTRVVGPPAERGRQYGSQARDLIHRSISNYEKVFQHYAAWDWSTVRRHAARFTTPVGDFSPDSLAEMVGIAEGAGVSLADILALNTRSEIMFAAPNPDHGPIQAPIHECTSFAVLPARSSTHSTVLGQNWDWLVHARDTTTLLQVTRDDGPSFLTLVEAGLLAKVGMNDAGVGLCTNTLISDGPEGRIGVPYHVLLRSVLDSASGPEAAQTVAKAERATSANYLIVDDTGFAVDLETVPRADGVRQFTPRDGQLTHANHFGSTDLTGEDLYLQNKPHTTLRLRNVAAGLAARTQVSVDYLKTVLADHRDRPASVCQHPDEAVHPRRRTATIAGVIMDVTRGTMHLAAGQPCQAQWEEWQVGVTP
jgi:isopenicillin-N N-acyltransferase-like protein